MPSEPSSRVEPNGLCRCGHTGKAHPYQGRECPCVNHGCDCRAFTKVPLPTVINDRCKCSHDRFRHNWGSESDGACSKPDCDCKAYAPVTVETVELPEPGCPPACAEAHTYSGSCMLRSAGPVPCQHNWHSPEDCPWAPDEAPAEPPAASIRDALQRLADRLPPPEGVECTPCRICGEMHEPYMGCMQPLPQPERRPPLTVQYSVAGGHPYEVSIPGDASVTAEDGVLIVKHPSAEILAITRVAPMEG